jgi:hypothetical protein
MLNEGLVYFLKMRYQGRKRFIVPFSGVSFGDVRDIRKGHHQRVKSGWIAVFGQAKEKLFVRLDGCHISLK